MNVSSPVISRRLIQTIIAFVDDADFFSCGISIKEKSQRLITKYNKLHGAKVGTGQLTKNNFYLWRTIINKAGEIEFRDIPYDIMVENTKIKQLSINEATKSLGVTYTSTSDCTAQFYFMKNKIIEVVGDNTIMTSVYIKYSTYRTRYYKTVIS